jgi:hypothetical protein
MRTAISAILAAIVLAACGLGETATSAAIGAKSKAQEIEQAKETQRQVVADIDKANQQAEQRLRDAEAR